MKYAVLLLLLVIGCTANNNMSGATTDTGGIPDKTFMLEGEIFKFLMDNVDNPTLTVNQGDTVRIELTSIGGTHDWTIDEFNAATGRVNTGQSTYVEFVADKTGTFEYYCSVDGHRQMGMRGNLVVV